jgi:hypothetical protein
VRRVRILNIAAANDNATTGPSAAQAGDSGTFPHAIRPRSRIRLAASGLFFFAYLIIQTVIPVYALFSDGWFSFAGWTMYTGLRQEPAFTVVYDDGTRESLDQIRERLGIGIVVGHKVDTARFVPPHLCGKLPSAQAVVIRDLRAQIEETYLCRP